MAELTLDAVGKKVHELIVNSNTIAAYCETPLQIRIAKAIAEAGANARPFTLLLGEWSDDVGQYAAAEASGLDVEHLAEPAPAAQMRDRWFAIRDVSSEYLAGNRRLLMFQDQHFFAQAVVAGARKAGASYDLVQDGYLDFDMNRIPAVKRALWPLARAIDRNGPQRPSTRLRPLLSKVLDP